MAVLLHRLTETGIVFQIESASGSILPILDTEPEGDVLLSQLLLIKELADNGQAFTDGDRVVIPHEEVVRLAPWDAELLGLPERYSYDLRVDTMGVFADPELQYDLGYYQHKDGGRFDVTRIGCLLSFDNASYLLDAKQYALASAVDQFNKKDPSSRSLGSNLRDFSRIKELAVDAKAHLSKALESEQVFAPDSKELSIEPSVSDAGTVSLIPGILSSGTGDGGDGSDELAAHRLDDCQIDVGFKKFPFVRQFYNTKDSNGESVRVALTDAQKKQLEIAKELGALPEDEVDRILENPEQFFDPDVVNLDLFSDRVVELGLYKPRFYPFVSPYKSQWLPGFIIEKGPDERKQVTFDNPEEAEEFKDAVDKAREAGEPTVQWKDDVIPIEQAEKIKAVAARQFENPDEPVKVDDEGTKVLIIKENIENLEYEVALAKLDAITYTYTTPPFLKSTFEPKDHQVDGIAWLQQLSRDYSGALLADDMGLGKTFQVLAFIKWHQVQCNPDGLPYLIVAPVTLLENWEREYQKFFDVGSPPPAQILHGDAAKQLIGSQKNWGSLTSTLQRNQLVFTNYETVRNHQLGICAVHWAAVALDEAQRIKSPGTLVTNAAKALKADFKIALTGTPVENSYVDLWCIMDFLAPGLLGGAKDFAREYQAPLKNPDTDVEALGAKLRVSLGQYMMRRLKADVAKDLPEKTVIVREREMPQVQVDRYMLEANSGSGGDSLDGRETLRILHNLKAISDHPLLLEHELDKLPVDQLIGQSAKLVETIDILDTVQKANEKAIIFAERKATQRLLYRVVSSRYKVHPRIINGDTPATARGLSTTKLSRQQSIDEFESETGFNVIIMSPIAAGVGLNVTEANHVIHYSRHWNPAKEQQATDRAYRIGQSRPVFVYFPIATIPNNEFESFDIVLNRLLERKKDLASASSVSV